MRKDMKCLGVHIWQRHRGVRSDRGDCYGEWGFIPWVSVTFFNEKGSACQDAGEI